MAEQPIQDGTSFCENCNQLTQWMDNTCQRYKPDGYGFGTKGLLTKEEARTGRINRINDMAEIIRIIVNGREKPWVKKFKKISIEDLLMLSFGVKPHDRVSITTTYSKGINNASGSMVIGDSVKVKEGMIFNVFLTDKS